MRHQVMLTYDDDLTQEQVETLVEQTVTGLRIEDVNSALPRGEETEFLTFWAEPLDDPSDTALAAINSAVEPLREHEDVDDIAVGVED